MVPREPSLIALIASEEVHFVEASNTCVVDDGGEQELTVKIGEFTGG